MRSGASSMMPSSASAMDVAASAGTGEDAFNGATVPIRIYVPELNVQKVIHFHRDELVWNVKQQCLATLPKVSHAPSSLCSCPALAGSVTKHSPPANHAPLKRSSLLLSRFKARFVIIPSISTNKPRRAKRPNWRRRDRDGSARENARNEWPSNGSSVLSFYGARRSDV